MFMKNESILELAQSSDPWALSPAKSTRGHIAGTTAPLAGAARQREELQENAVSRWIGK